MRILRRRGWELPEWMATPEAFVLGRRTALAGAGSIALAGSVREGGHRGRLADAGVADHERALASAALDLVQQAGERAELPSPADDTLGHTDTVRRPAPRGKC